jgi:protein involved in polysaccharide export with SLBB domain
MNLSSKLSLLACGVLLAGMFLSGCTSPQTPEFTDNPNPPTGSTATSMGMTNGDLPSLPPTKALFQPGETVTVSTSTGSDAYPGPIAPAGQPYLISDDGGITLPLIGHVQAGGKTPSELQDEITKLYVPQYFVRLTVTVTAPQRAYYVGGEVMHPGAQIYIGTTTVTKAIQAAGDFTQFASHRVWLNRADGTRLRVNVDTALSDSTKDPQVYPGDQIQVPRRIW